MPQNNLDYYYTPGNGVYYRIVNKKMTKGQLVIVIDPTHKMYGKIGVLTTNAGRKARVKFNTFNKQNISARKLQTLDRVK